MHTNAIRFSPAIGEVLRAGRGAINISLDSGTPETYRRVKGVDAFDKVVSSLRQYCDAASDTGQIHLKYIIFEANNAIAEIESFLSLCSSLHIKNIQLSFDFRELNADALSRKSLLAAAFLQRRAKDMGLVCLPFFLPQKEAEKLKELEKEFFQ